MVYDAQSTPMYCRIGRTCLVSSTQCNVDTPAGKPPFERKIAKILEASKVCLVRVGNIYRIYSIDGWRFLKMNTKLLLAIRTSKKVTSPDAP